MNTDKKIITYHDLPKLSQRLHKGGKTIVFTSGCYDLLHLGHIIHLHYCKSKGDVLVVNVGNDATVRAVKGPTRPVLNERFRARMVAALATTDYVVISEESGKMDHTRFVRLLKPDVYVLNQTDSAIREKRKLIESVGGKLHLCRRLPPGNLKGGISTTTLKQQLGDEQKM